MGWLFWQEILGTFQWFYEHSSLPEMTQPANSYVGEGDTSAWLTYTEVTALPGGRFLCTYSPRYNPLEGFTWLTTPQDAG